MVIFHSFYGLDIFHYIYIHIYICMHIFLIQSCIDGYLGCFSVISRNQEGPGEMGKAVLIPKDDQEKMKELFKINQFNLMASDLIALNRSLPDVRLEG
ncbi:hypothetical protein FD755_007254 [Muntiacus reevesi]|uniref:Uncharacterized protein n=1 Tax=Muntiacus reevesi TaxID=9886 RepID=A0A5J5MH45_MUNRE|nr:hypothetical protein FD755_007254 [Muntiacus reevesi]